MSSRYPVQIHQAGSPSVRSSYSLSSGTYGSSSGSSPSSSPSRSVASGTHREHDAAKHVSGVVKSGSNVVINHNRTDYQHGSPSPPYRK